MIRLRTPTTRQSIPTAAQALSQRSKDIISSSLAKLNDRLNNISPLAPESLKCFGEALLSCCTDLLLPESPGLVLSSVDRAELVVDVIETYIRDGMVEEAKALNKRMNAHAFLCLGSDSLTNVQIARADDLCSGKTEVLDVNPKSAQEIRESYLLNIGCMGNIADYESIPSDYAKNPQALMRRLRNAGNLVLAQRIQALISVESGNAPKGFRTYLATRGQDQSDYINSFDQEFSELLEYALKAGVSESIVASNAEEISDLPSSSRVKLELARTAFSENKLSNALAFVEAIPLEHWRPGILGFFAASLHHQGKDAKSLVKTALNHGMKVADEDLTAFAVPIFRSKTASSLSSLIQLGAELTKSHFLKNSAQ